MTTPRQRVQLYDTTLRDGTQGHNISLSLQDKLLIARRLDELGVNYIEGGYPLSNHKDVAFFKESASVGLKSVMPVHLGMTGRRKTRVQDYEVINALLAARTPT